MTKSLIPKTPALNNLASCTCNVVRTLRRLKSELRGASFEFSDATLQELNHLGVGFVSLTEALHLTTPAGRTMAGLLAIFAEFEREVLRERTRAGLAEARQNGKRLGRPETAARHADEIRKLHLAGISKSEIARRLQIGRTSVRRILGAKS